MYINARMAIMPVILGWLVSKSIHNKIDLYRQKKIEEKKGSPCIIALYVLNYILY